MKNKKLLGYLMIFCAATVLISFGLTVYMSARIIITEVADLEIFIGAEPVYTVIAVCAAVFFIFLAVLACALLWCGVKIIKNPDYKFKINDFIKIR